MDAMTASDETLVRGVLNGDPAAFADLYRRWSRVIVALCCDTTGDVHAAADLAQEVFLRAYRRLADLREPRRFAAWLCGIARHACREWRREQARTRRRLQGWARAAGPPAQAAAPDSSAEPQLAALRAAIRGLPATERLALHVFYLQDRNIEDLCAVLELSRSAAYRLLTRARRRLRDRLSLEEVPS